MPPTLLPNHARPRTAHWLAMLLACLSGAAMLAAGLEYAHYRTLINPHQTPLPRSDGVVLFSLLWAKSLLVMVPVLAVAGATLWLRCPRTAWALFLAGAALVFSWLVIDLCVHAGTGMHVLSFMRLLRNPQAARFAGGVLLVLRPYALIIALVVGGVLAAALASHGVARWLGGACQRRGVRGVAATATAGFAALIILALPAQLLFSRPAVMEQFVGQDLPVPLPSLTTVEPLPVPDAAIEFRNRLGERLSLLWQQDRDRSIEAAAPDTTARLSNPDPPDVLVLLFESLRADALRAEVMPRLCARAEAGWRFERHYSAANNSHPGLFGLLLGRYPLGYHAAVKAGTPPQLPLFFQRSGYQTTYLATTPLKWEGMEGYLDTPAFDRIIVEDQGGWPGRDLRTLAHIRRIFRQPRLQPRFVVAFFVSTHYPYEYPPEYERFRPAATVEMVNAPTRRQYRPAILNRYHNAAGFLDHQFDLLLDDLDLRRTVVVVTSDHGESFYEDGTMVHSSRLSDVQTRVPLFLLGPGAPRASTARGTSHVDLLPTLAHVVDGRPVALARTHGRDLLALPAAAPDEVMIFMMEPGATPYMRAAVLTPQGRLALRFGLGQEPEERRLQVLGLINDAGALDLDASATPQELRDWTAVGGRALRLLAE